MRFAKRKKLSEKKYDASRVVRKSPFIGSIIICKFSNNKEQFSFIFFILILKLNIELNVREFSVAFDFGDFFFVSIPACTHFFKRMISATP